MNEPITPSASPWESDVEGLMHRYLDQTITDLDLADLQQRLRLDARSRQAFVDLQIDGFLLHELFRQKAFGDHQEPDGGPFKRINIRYLTVFWGGTVAAAVIGLIFLFSSLSGSNQRLRLERLAKQSSISNVFMSGEWRAAFLGQFTPDRLSAMALENEYILTEGIIELAFPSGARSIIESPSIFRVVDNDRLALDSGSCSVYAPPGAEGFCVQTHLVHVVDRGTRLQVGVSPTSYTEVQVVEGKAELLIPEFARSGYRKSKDVLTKKFLSRAYLTGAQAIAINGDGELTPHRIPFNPDRYRKWVPDRLVDYHVIRDSKGGASELVQMTVQREGRMIDFHVSELIGVNVLWFKPQSGGWQTGVVAGPSELPADRASVLSDAYLTTGLINIGGQEQPSAIPRIDSFIELQDQSIIRGLAVKFQTPVINRVGPDILLFEFVRVLTETAANSFHVIPLPSEGKRRALRVASDDYDIGLASSKSLPLGQYHVYGYENRIEQLSDLLLPTFRRSPVQSGFRLAAVSIDLTDLGYDLGEPVEELLFQSTSQDHRQLLDPVVIVGLP